MPATYVYARFSPRPNAEDCKSIEVQLDACQRYCTMNGWEVTEVYADPETSARTVPFCERDSAGAMFSKLKKGDRIVCARLDRAFRNTVDGLLTFEKFNKKGVTIYFAAQDGCSLTTATAQGKLLLSLMLSVTEYEPGIISERTKAAFAHRKSNLVNTFASGKVPYGYEEDFSEGNREGTTAAKRLKFCQAERSVIRLILLRSQGGANPNAIALQLNGENSLCRGKDWNGVKIKRVLNLWQYDEATLEAIPIGK